jgi:DNA helicase-2/ATP-dependent DNA helicase PcrA
LLNSIKEFTETPTEDGELLDKSLGSYLQQITLLTDADDDKGETDVVKLMTIHAAKGLEFPVIFVGGLEETLFPSAMSINTREELEEERRLFYVAMTRAQEWLGLSYCEGRKRYGKIMPCHPSPFLKELPLELIEDAAEKSKQPVTAETGKALFSAMRSAVKLAFAPSIPYR